MINKHVFREGEYGHLELVGDFESLYKEEADPWQQSASVEGEIPYAIQQYYINSRAQLISALRRHVNGNDTLGLEIGCGHGHVVELLSGLSPHARWHGMDVSPTAVRQASDLHPKLRFFVGDITNPLMPAQATYDVIVLGQLLWYVMHAMGYVMANCYRALAPGGLLVVSQAFLTGEQRYGANIAKGFDGAVRLLLQYPRYFKLIEARYEDKLGLAHDDGLIIMRKI